MTEAHLTKLLERGARRFRAQRALWAGLAGLGVGVVLASLLIFLVRLFPLRGAGSGSEMSLAEAAVALPVAVALAVFAVVYCRSRPALDTVALLLDRRAGTAEHLVTWWQLRAAPLADARGSEDLQRGFRAAQLAATLALAPRLDPKRLLPLRLPEWGRALWLALLLLCCALLMPPRVRAERDPAGGKPGDTASLGLRTGGGAGGVLATPGQTPRVQVLKPTELLAFQLTATDPQLPPAARAAALKELLRKIGNVPESELAPEVRELLEALRDDGTQKNGKNGEKNGSVLAPAKGDNPAEPGAPPEGAAQVPDFREKAVSAVEQCFPDVKEQLGRYYAAETRNPKLEIRRKEQ
jgi:hypothetical protein